MHHRILPNLQNASRKKAKTAYRKYQSEDLPPQFRFPPRPAKTRYAHASRSLFPKRQNSETRYEKRSLRCRSRRGARGSCVRRRAMCSGDTARKILRNFRYSRSENEPKKESTVGFPKPPTEKPATPPVFLGYARGKRTPLPRSRRATRRATM